MNLQSKEFENCIQKAFFNPDQATRNKNESILTGTLEANPNSFINLCAMTLNSGDCSIQIKQTIATLLKISLEKGGSSEPLWQSLTRESQEILKEQSLEMLVSLSEPLRIAGANLTAVVFIMDCQHEKRWGSLLGNLSTCQKHEDENIRRTAVKTIGFICESLKRLEIKSLPREQVDVLLTGVCLGLETYTPDILHSFKALEHSLAFFFEHFNSGDVRDFLMNLIVGNLTLALQKREDDVVAQALLCLSKVRTLMGWGFGKYSEKVYDTVMDVYVNPKVKSFFVANEFLNGSMEWQEKEKRRDPTLELRGESLTGRVVSSTVQLLRSEECCHCFESQNSVLDSALELLHHVNLNFFPKVKDFQFNKITELISLSEFQSKASALVLLESWLELPKVEQIFNLISRSFLGVLGELEASPDTLVEFRALKIIRKVAEHFPQIFIDDQHFEIVYGTLNNARFFEQVNILSMEVVCDTWISLAANTPKLPQVCYLKLQSKNEYTIHFLLDLLENPNTTILQKDFIYTTSIALIRNLSPKEQLTKWLGWMWDRHKTLRGFGNSSAHQIELGCVFSVINIILQTILQTRSDHPFLEDPQLLTLVESLDFLFQQDPQVSPEALDVYCSLVQLRPSLFESRVPHLLEAYICPGLSQRTRLDIFVACLQSLICLASLFPNPTQTTLLPFFPSLLQILESAHIPREINLKLLGSLTDLIALCPELATRNLEQILQLICFGFEALFEMMTDSQEKSNFLFLSDTLFDLVLCLIHEIYYTSSDKRDILEKFFSEMCGFLSMILAKDSFGWTGVSWSRDLLMMLMDIWYHQSHSPFLDPTLLRSLYWKLNSFDHVESVGNVLNEVRPHLFPENHI
jgi:hypothetical protein